MEGKTRKDDADLYESLAEDKRSSKGGVGPVAIVLMIAALVVIVGYFVFLNKSDKKTEIVSGEKQQSFEEIHGSRSAGKEAVSEGGPDKVEEHFNAGVRFSLRRDYDRAISEYSKALELNPNAAEIHSNLGFAYLDNEDVDMSIVEQKKAIELDPNIANAYYGLALALEKKGDVEGAIANWEKYLEIAPTGTIWWNKAKAKLEEIKGLSK